MTAYTVLRRILVRLPVHRILSSSPSHRLAVRVDPAIYLTAITTAGALWAGTTWHGE